MMDLNTQIATLIFSFLYGIFFSLFLTLNYKLIYGEIKIYKIIITFLFVLTNVFIYFLILRKINNGIFHTYSIIMIIIGYTIENILAKEITKRFKKIVKHKKIILKI